MTFSTCERHPRRQTGAEAPEQSGYTTISTWWHYATAKLLAVLYRHGVSVARERMCGGQSNKFT
jgi:hypothetical protein